MTDDLRPPYRIAFDTARDPYAARNALGIAGTGAGLITSVSSPLVVTAGNLTVDLTSSPQGRLTLQTLTPVMTTTQSAKTTIYYTPYVGNKVPIYDGTNMVMTTFAELSVATTDTAKSPAAIGASKVNDWFVWSDAGTVRIGHGPDWTNDTTRSAGTALVRVNGVLLNNASITNGPAASRGTYVGTTRSNASSQLDWIYGALAIGGTAAFFGVWNCYNRVVIMSKVQDSKDSWTRTAGTTGQADTADSMRVSFVTGLQEDWVYAKYNCTAQPSTVTGNCAVGVGYDTTSAFTGMTNPLASTNTILAPCFGDDAQQPLGFHYFQAIEQATTVSGTFGGDFGVPTTYQNGLIFQGRF